MSLPFNLSAALNYIVDFLENWFLRHSFLLAAILKRFLNAVKCLKNNYHCETELIEFLLINQLKIFSIRIIQSAKNI